MSVQKFENVYIVAARRSAHTVGKRGALADLFVEDMLAPVIKAVIKDSKAPPESIGDVIIGNVLGPGSSILPVRQACLLAGLPVEVPCVTCNRQCSSGLQAMAQAASAISCNQIHTAIAGGVESMSKASMTALAAGGTSEDVLKCPEAMKCFISMGITSENVACKFSVSREEQDKFAIESHKKALNAQKQGKFNEEIVPIIVKGVPVNSDSTVRVTTINDLARLNPAFKLGGTTTPGNSSPVTDGASAVVMMSGDRAASLQANIMGKFVAYVAVGCDPEIMGIGPAIAIPTLLNQQGLTISDIDLFEINEAFASQSIYCVKKLGIPVDKVNVNGGAIALGHPLGSTGSRLVATGLRELKRRNGKYLVISMCIGTGMGAAALIEGV